MPLTKGPWLHEMNWRSVEEHLQTDDVALVPVGATEQHGDHTPLLVDTAWAIAVSEGAAKAAKALAVPPLHFGWSPHHLAYSGAITLRPETLINVLVDVCESLIHHGFKRIILVNGNRVANFPPMEIAAAKVRFKTGAYVSVVDVGLIAKEEISEICEPGENGHAGDSETSFMLHWQPELVDMSKAQAGAHHEGGAFPTNQMPVDPPFDKNSISVRAIGPEYRRASQPTGIGGNATIATSAKGKAVLDAIVANVVKHIEDIRRKELDVRAPEIPI